MTLPRSIFCSSTGLESPRLQHFRVLEGKKRKGMMMITIFAVGTLEFRGVSEPIRVARERLNYVQVSIADFSILFTVIYVLAAIFCKSIELRQDHESVKVVFPVHFEYGH